MKKTSSAAATAAADHDQHEGEQPAAVVEQFPGGATPPEGEPENNDPVVPPRLSGEVQACVDSVASTITGCSESEIKNFLATADFAVRQIALQLANRWKEICRTAEANGKDGEKSSKVGIAVKIDIDHSNLLLMDTKVKLGFARKYSESAETQEDLRQVEFKIPNS
jgi:hypothetical protein